MGYTEPYCNTVHSRSVITSPVAPILSNHTTRTRYTSSSLVTAGLSSEMSDTTSKQGKPFSCRQGSHTDSNNSPTISLLGLFSMDPRAVSSPPGDCEFVKPRCL